MSNSDNPSNVDWRAEYERLKAECAGIVEAWDAADNSDNMKALLADVNEIARGVQCPGCGANQTDERGACLWCKTLYRQPALPPGEYEAKLVEVDVRSDGVAMKVELPNATTTTIVSRPVDPDRRVNNFIAAVGLKPTDEMTDKARDATWLRRQAAFVEEQSRLTQKAALDGVMPTANHVECAPSCIDHAPGCTKTFCRHMTGHVNECWLQELTRAGACTQTTPVALTLFELRKVCSILMHNAMVLADADASVPHELQTAFDKLLAAKDKLLKGQS